MTSQGNYRLLGICLVAGGTSFITSLCALALSGVQLTATVLASLVQACVQLLGFGGVVFAVLYHEQRTMLAKHREERNAKARRMLRSMNEPITQQPRESWASMGGGVLQHDEAIARGRDIYLYGGAGFTSGFIAVGLALVLLMIQSVSFGTSQVATFGINLLVSVEIALIATGLASFISAWIESLKLPLEPY